jgi:hypothetical protein
VMDAASKVDKTGLQTQETDSNGDGRVDTWSGFDSAGKPVREARDTNGDGKPDVLTRFDENGRGVEQDVVEGNATRPNKKLFLAPDGSVTAQCLDTNGDGKFDARATVESGTVSEVILDTDANGVPDQREIYQGGERVRLEADTNKDKRPDVVQTFSAGNVVRQDEDTNFDGKIDRSFQGTKSVPVTDPKAPSPLPALNCGPLDPFW